MRREKARPGIDVCTTGIRYRLYNSAMLVLSKLGLELAADLPEGVSDVPREGLTVRRLKCSPSLLCIQSDKGDLLERLPDGEVLDGPQGVSGPQRAPDRG